jgi:hypothetical protein
MRAVVFLERIILNNLSNSAGRKDLLNGLFAAIAFAFDCLSSTGSPLPGIIQ